MIGGDNGLGAWEKSEETLKRISDERDNILTEKATTKNFGEPLKNSSDYEFITTKQMTISTTTIKNSYSGNGSTTTFNYTFKITDQDDIDVIIRSSSGTETTKTITTHYTVTGVGNASGGTVVFTSGNIPSGTETVVLEDPLLKRKV